MEKLLIFLLTCFLFLIELCGIVLPLQVTALVGIGLFVWYIFGAIYVARQPALSLSIYFLVLYLTVCFNFWLRLLDPDILISVHSQQYQVDALFAHASHLSALGLSSFGLGWLDFRRRVPGQFNREALNNCSVDKVRSTFIFKTFHFWCTLFLGGCFLFLVAPRSTIIQTDYFTAFNSSETFGLNILRPAAYLLIVYAMIICIQNPTRIRWISWLCVFLFGLFYAGFLAGNRVEAIGLVMAVAIVWQWKRRKNYSIRGVLVVGIMMIVFLQALGAVRSSFFRGDIEIETLLRMRPKESNNVLVYTQGDVALTSLATLGLIRDGFIDFDYGKTFANVFLSTLPTSITPDRPVAFSWRIASFTSIGGGSFLINEPFVAAGAFGVIVFLFFLGWFIRKIEFDQNKISGMILYVTVTLGLSRFEYYGWLAGYKYLLTAVVVYYGSLLPASILAKASTMRFKRRLIKA